MESLYFTSTAQARAYMEQHPDRGIVLFAGVEMVQELSAVAGPHVVLSSTAGEYTSKGFQEGVISGFTYPIDQVEVVEVESPAILSVHELQAAYTRVKNNKNAFMFILYDGLSGQEESVMTTLFFADNDFKVVGGSAGDYVQFKETAIYIGKRRVAGAALFFNYHKRTQVLKENIYYTTGQRLLVTDADPLTRVVHSFNNRPAATEYAAVLGIQEHELERAFMNNPLGKVIKGQTYITSPMKVNPDRSITFYAQVVPNTFLDVLQPSKLQESFQETLDSLAFRPSFVLSVHCILRSLKFKSENTWKLLDNALLGVCSNQAGFISYGEQLQDKHFNQTMVLIAFE
ncbi:FIST N-terminal domain-containing protein [Paenibacillus hunanensis]|uniref:FIST signal transduction protein n=1 Tax=Paenibacillus hunanensis TaxID=539262 RepID=UPI002A69ECB5|nr:FIST N-terminal domain-containing protein [Paenibacillus hunanensis]WPP42638.1 FIST N-terminal domain-containing protein [Paenibacillus hunanensis]